jgi:hypothetical protein
MFDPRFKNMRLVTMFMCCENVALVIAEYDEKLVMLLLMKANKFLMFGRVEVTFELHSEGDSKVLFHITSLITETCKDIVSKELVGFR